MPPHTVTDKDGGKTGHRKRCKIPERLYSVVTVRLIPPGLLSQIYGMRWVS